MRVRIELRREAGIFIARFRPQEGITGELSTERRTVNDRPVVFLHVRPESRQGYPHEVRAGPSLFEPRILRVFDDELHLVGYEVVGKAIHLQEWDVTLNPPRLT